MDDSERLDPACAKCGSSVLLAVPAVRRSTRDQLEALPLGVWRYGRFLPEVESKNVVTLGEGGTPLLQAQRLGKEIGLGNLLIKDESRNPTGSFTDRGSTVLVSLAREDGVKECSCVTTGNLGASLAAYCAKADIKARVAIYQGTDQGKLHQMMAFGAELEPSPVRGRLQGWGAGSLRVSPANPFLLQGEKTTGFEIADELGWSLPDVIVVPVGTGGHLLMIWQAIMELRESGILGASHCRLLGVRVGRPPSDKAAGKGHGPSLRGLTLLELGESEPLLRKEAEDAIEESRGTTLDARPGDVFRAMGLLARTEGIFAEPSSASVVAALSGAVEAGVLDRDETIVCVVTGSGLKDPRAVTRIVKEANKGALSEQSPLPSPQIGETKLALLVLLQNSPSYGYELRHNLAPVRQMSTASVYQHLSELEGFALVRKKGSVLSKGRERVLYELTKRGSDFLKLAQKLERAREMQA